MQDAAKVDLSNDIYLMRTTSRNPNIIIDGDLSETGTLAKVTLENYVANDVILDQNYGDSYVGRYYSQFEITNSAWKINSSGNLVSN